MTKAIVVLLRKEDMNLDEFRQYWLTVHAPLVTRIPGVRRYVQDHVSREEGQENRPCDGIEEIEFDSPEALQTGLASEAGVKAIEDLSAFADLGHSGVVYTEQVPIDTPASARS